MMLGAWQDFAGGGIFWEKLKLEILIFKYFSIIEVTAGNGNISFIKNDVK